MLGMFFTELSRSNFDKCQKMLNPKAQRKKKFTKNLSPMNKFFQKSTLEDLVIEEDLQRTPSLYFIGNQVGLWDPIPLNQRNEIRLHKNTKINDKF